MVSFIEIKSTTCYLQDFIIKNKDTSEAKALSLFLSYEDKRTKEENSSYKDEKTKLRTDRITLIRNMQCETPFERDGLCCILKDTYKPDIIEAISEIFDITDFKEFVIICKELESAQKIKGESSSEIKEALTNLQIKIIKDAAKNTNKEFAKQSLTWIIVNGSSIKLILEAKKQALANKLTLFPLPWCLNTMIIESFSEDKLPDEIEISPKKTELISKTILQRDQLTT